jgi:CheY-like chemotaxis protein
MHDPRKPRQLRPGALQVLVLDTNNFTRGLIADILRGQNVTNIHCAHDEFEAMRLLQDKPVDLIFLSWEETEEFDGLRFIRSMRQRPDPRLRRLPVVLITSNLTRQMIINARDAGVDEFLTKPLAPAAVQQRLHMTIETPRPFVDCPAYLGPCRRRKNPADYYGAKRRSGDLASDQATPMVDADEEEAKAPIRVALAALRAACTHLKTALSSFEAYVEVACPKGVADPHVLTTALAALEQLAALPPSYKEARESVAVALGKAIHKKLAA